MLRQHQSQLELLYNVLSNRRIAHFIASLQCYNIYDASDEDSRLRTTKYFDYAEDIRDALEKYPHVNTRGYWGSSEAFRNNPDCTTALLLTLLPNLRHVYIWEPRHQTWHMIRDIATRYSQKGKASDYFALANLTSAFIETRYSC